MRNQIFIRNKKKKLKELYYLMKKIIKLKEFNDEKKT